MERITLSEFEAFKFGHTQNENAATGCSVIICEQGAVCGIDVRGGSPGTRDTDALNPIFNRKVVHTVLLTGGSTFGLDAAGGVMKFLEERKIGRDVGVTTVPNVCAAVLFDLKCVDHKIRPDEKMGYESCQNAYLNSPFLSGSVGAGTGATIGKINGPAYAMKGGIGTCAFRFGDLMVAAVVAVNAVGDVTDHEKIIAGALNKTKTGFIDSEKVILERYQDFKDFFSGNTVIGCVVTNGKLTKNQATKLASVAQNGIA